MTDDPPTITTIELRTPDEIATALGKMQDRASAHAARQGDWNPLLLRLRAGEPLGPSERAILIELFSGVLKYSSVTVGKRAPAISKTDTRDLDVVNYMLNKMYEGITKTEAAHLAEVEFEIGISTVWSIVSQHADVFFANFGGEAE